MASKEGDPADAEEESSFGQLKSCEVVDEKEDIGMLWSPNKKAKLDEIQPKDVESTADLLDLWKSPAVSQFNL